LASWPEAKAKAKSQAETGPEAETGPKELVEPAAAALAIVDTAVWLWIFDLCALKTLNCVLHSNHFAKAQNR